MRWLITGASGQLGREIAPLVDGRALDRAALDITDAAAVTDALEGVDVVVNCAAWTAVDDAEAHEDEALLVNGIAPGLLADACARRGTRLVQVSTDYVFDGHGSAPYDEAAVVSPVTAYGRTKAAGERSVLAYERGVVARTAWLYSAFGSNFVTTMLRMERDREDIAVVDDQVGQPTWAADAARQIVLLVDAIDRGWADGGVWHVTNSGQASWWEFARAIFSGVGADPGRVTPCDSAQFPRPARRPAYSVLGHRRWYAARLPVPRPWQEALAEALPAVSAALRG